MIGPGKAREKVVVRSLLCFWAVGELSMSLTDVPKKLGISVPTVSVVVQRGEKIARQEELELPVFLNIKI